MDSADARPLAAHRIVFDGPSPRIMEGQIGRRTLGLDFFAFELPARALSLSLSLNRCFHRRTAQGHTATRTGRSDSKT